MTSELIRGDGLFPPAAYTRHDETPDTEFYGYPHKVVHIDDGAIAALGRLYAEVLPAGGQLLDLMSSWRTHLPRDFRAGEVIGLGLNAEEMTDNPQLTDHVVHDMNQAPWLPFDDEAFDGAMCAVSIQYVIHPLSLFRQVRRVLRQAAPFVVSFSNRCFPTKAAAVWLDTTDEQLSCSFVHTPKLPVDGSISPQRTGRRPLAIRCTRCGRARGQDDELALAARSRLHGATLVPLRACSYAQPIRTD